jgi:putative flippase GtrA
LAAVPAFVIAISWNFVLNRIFTFNYDLGLSAGKSFFHFFLVCVFGLIARLVIMHLLLSYTAMSQGKLYIVASIIGITGATLVNFFGSKVFAFPEDKTLDESR